MTTRFPSDIPYLYLAQDDLFRLGNASAPRLDHVRADDVDTFELKGVHMVVANGKGISLFDESGIARLRGGWLWKIPQGTSRPEGLGLYNDPGAHFALCPTRVMSVESYKGLLLDLASLCVRLRKI